MRPLRSRAHLGAVRTALGLAALVAIVACVDSPTAPSPSTTTAVAARDAARTVTATDLGTYGEALAIAPNGRIVGHRYFTSSHHAAVWDDGVLTDLGTVGGGANSSANDVNARGRIAGWSTTSAGEFVAVVWESGVPTVLPSLGGYYSTAEAIRM